MIKKAKPFLLLIVTTMLTTASCNNNVISFENSSISHYDESFFFSDSSVDEINNQNSSSDSINNQNSSSVSYSSLKEPSYSDDLFDCFLLDDGTYSIKAKSVDVINGTLYIPETINGIRITKIEDKGFGGCKSINDIKFSQNLKVIGEMAFSGLGDIDELLIPDNVIDIKNAAFANTHINKAIIGKGLTVINTQVFSLSRLKEIVLGENVTEIKAYAFSSNDFETFSLTDKVSKIENPCFTNCGSLTTFYVGENNTSFVLKNGSIYNKDETTLVCYPTGATNQNYAISDGTETIDAQAFNGCKNVKSIICPNSLKSIGKEAFVDCRSIESIVVKEGLKTIGQGAFSGTVIESFDLPSSLEEIGLYAFDTNSVYINITINENNPYFAIYNKTIYSKDFKRLILCFNNDIEVYEIKQETEVLTFGSFSRFNTSIKKIVTNSKLITVNSPFSRIHNLEEIVLSDSITSFGYAPFRSCLNLQRIEIPNKIDEIEQDFFYGCKKLNTLVLPVSIKKIGSYAFYDTGRLKEISFKGTIAEWNSIEKASNLADCNNITVHCLNGDTTINISQ